jgi:hypothetical protein
MAIRKSYKKEVKYAVSVTSTQESAGQVDLPLTAGYSGQLLYAQVDLRDSDGKQKSGLQITTSGNFVVVANETVSLAANDILSASLNYV